jgi:hypothetical protein
MSAITFRDSAVMNQRIADTSVTTPFASFTQPILKTDLEHRDDCVLRESSTGGRDAAVVQAFDIAIPAKTLNFGTLNREPLGVYSTQLCVRSYLNLQLANSNHWFVSELLPCIGLWQQFCSLP